MKSRTRLLLIDDDRLVLATIGAGLRSAGYETHHAESTEEAESLLASGLRPDLAIVDIRMAGQSGLTLARRLRELDHIPFVMFSAYREQAMVDEANALGALAYLVKPLDLPQLIPIIEAALARAYELQSLRDARSQLQGALDDDRNMSVAIGITMARERLSRQAAFEKLRRDARNARCKLSELAAGIIASHESQCT